MRPPSFIVAALIALGGCTHLELPAKSPLSALPPVQNAVVLDVLFARFPQGDPQLNGPVWQEIDELQLTPEERRRLEGNGLRVGVLSGSLPLELEQLLDMGDEAKPADQPQAVDVDSPAQPTRRRQLSIRGGRRANIIVMGERERRNELPLLLRGADDRIEGRTYRKVMGLFAARAYPQGDGVVRLELTPELEHGEAQKRFTPGEGMFKVEFGPPHEVIEPLRFTVRLQPGQILVVSSIPAREGSLGHHLFTEREGDVTMQKMLLVRLAQCDYDDRFDAPQAESPTDAP